MSGAGVPVRLSATEVDENDSDEEERFQQREGSRRSSLGSGPRANSQLVSGGRHSDGSTPRSGHSPDGSMADLAEEETPMPNEYNVSQSDYFEQAAPSNEEAEQNFGRVGGLPPSKLKTDQQRKIEDDLRRRGSVDDRSMTMTGQRLFVANPDLSD